MAAYRLIWILFIFICCNCNTKQNENDVISKNSSDFIIKDTTAIDTLVNQYSAVVVGYSNKTSNKTFEIRTWLKFPENLKFENFLSTDVLLSHKRNINLNFKNLENSSASADQLNVLKKSLEKEYRILKEANFNIHYKILTVDVYDDCCGHFIVNMYTGEVSLIAFSLWGADFKANSTLLILNPIEKLYSSHNYNKEEFSLGNNYYPTNSNERGPEAYIMINGLFKRVY